MSVSPIYIKSDIGEINFENYVYKDYELTIFPVNGRALNVSSSKNRIDKTITFNNLIKYDNDGKVFEWKNNSWTLITNYFESTYEGIKIYKNNLYSSIKTEISSKTININKPWFYMMYGPSSSESVSRVTSITFQNNIYTFTSDIGKVEFDIFGNPIRSLTTGNLPTVPLLRFVVYRYNGFSQMTSSYLTNLYNSLPKCTDPPSSSNQYIYYWGRCGFNVDNLNIYVYGESIAPGNSQRTVHKIYKNINDPTWDLLFFISDNGTTDKGVAFKLNGTPVKVYERRDNGWDARDITPDVGYRIYRKDGFTNFIPNSSTSVLERYIYKTISRDIKYLIDNPSNQFQIEIPNDKPTNRIFVYQANNNKLLHITDYIAKGTTQNVNTQKVTINYTNNNGVLNVSSSVVPVNPLPVPNFYKSNLSSDCINSNQYFSCQSQPDMICPDNYIIDTINTGPQTIKYRCKNIYSTSENSLRGLGNNPTSETTSDNSGFAKSKTYWLSDGIRGISFVKGNGNTVLTGSSNGNMSDFSCENGKINGFNGTIFQNTGNIIQLKTFCALPSIK